MKYSKSHIRAMEKTLRKFERLFKNPEKEYKKWKNQTIVSILCQEVGIDSCSRCFLFGINDKNWCLGLRVIYCMEYEEIMYILFEGKNKPTKKNLNLFVFIMKEYYKQIIKHLNKLDYFWEVR